MMPSTKYDNSSIGNEWPEREKAMRAESRKATAQYAKLLGVQDPNTKIALSVLKTEPIQQPRSILVPPVPFTRELILTLATGISPYRPPVPRARIIREVCRKHGITEAQIRSDCRDMPLVRARQEAMYRLRTERQLSYPTIGRELGGRDHSTVIHGVKRHEDRLAQGDAL